MKFERILTISSALLILTGFYAILITGSYTVSVLLGIAVTMAYWGWGNRLSEFFPVPKWAWNAVAILLLVYLTYDSFFRSLDLVGNGIQFVVYLQVVKLLSPKENRDHLQIYLLSFLHILASTVITTDLSFALPFILYIILATWTLAMFNLKMQLESAVPRERKEAAVSTLLMSRDIITRGFLGMTSGLALSVISITLMIFFSFPRVSMGNFLKRVDVRQNVSGFSEEVTLGTIGNIKLNNRITLRVELEAQDLEVLNVEKLYWRGTASDTFDGRKWTQSDEVRSSIRMDIDNPVLKVGRQTPWVGKTLSYRVFMEALNPPILFGADPLLQVTWDKPMIERIFRGSLGLAEDSYSGLYFMGKNLYAADLTYTAESLLAEPPQTLLEKTAIMTDPDYSSLQYLKLPVLDPDVKTLIENIPIRSDSAYERARSIIRYLEDNYRYTLSVQDIGTTDPLRFFFLEKKQGHCEYFSTALAIALRVHGIPSRNVVGFRGGELNPFGKYLAVRQSDAHSWVEAYLPPAGWIRFDPSPLDSTVMQRKSRFKAIYQMIDYLRLRWNKYIIEYDLRSQAQIIERIGRTVSRWLRSTERSTGRKELQDGQTQKPREKISIPVWLIFATGLLGAITLILRRRYLRKRAAFGEYSEVLNLLRRAGFTKRPDETAIELEERVQSKMGPVPPLHDLTWMYYEQRFGFRKKKPALWKTSSMSLKNFLKKRAHRESKGRFGITRNQRQNQ